MSVLKTCPFRCSLDKDFKCSNCDSRGRIYNYDKESCVQDSSVAYEDVVPYKPVVEGVPTAIGGMPVSQVKAERSKRNNEHFRKEVYPTLAKEDRKLFAKKHNIKT